MKCTIWDLLFWFALATILWFYAHSLESDISQLQSEVTCLNQELIDCQQSHTVGLASYYSHGFHGRKTANGEVFDSLAFTCAHPRLPFGTKIKVTALRSGRSVIVKVNDRGPFIAGRIVDLSFAGAAKLGMVKAGVEVVSIMEVK